MTKILLVRHGQASFGAANYDQLSELGQRQASLLGEYWPSIGVAPNRAWAGRLSRQQHTAELALAAQADAPPVQVTPAFDEYDTETLFTAYQKPILAALEKMGAKAKEGEHYLQDPAQFFTALKVMYSAWTAGEAAEPIPGFEPWLDFKDRIMTGLQKAAAEAAEQGAETTAIFTSGGVISLVLQQCWRMPPEMLMQVNWRVANSGVTELQFSKRGFSVLGFNAISHLQLKQEDGLITYR